MPLQKTNYSRVLSNLAKTILYPFLGSWKQRSISILSLMLGFFISSFLLSYLLQKVVYRVFIVFFIVVFIEILVRIRRSINTKSTTLFWISLDNFRIGVTYGIVLEAFKLGS